MEKAVPQWKVKNFASAAVKGEITELHETRDLFGQLLYLSTLKESGPKKIFHFPLTPVPLSLAHVDGSMNKTEKSKLMNKQEVKEQCNKN